MAKNKMAQVAELLGVEMNEEFNICGSIFLYRINENGIEIEEGNGWSSYDIVLPSILTGKYEIKRLPWKPETNETYYYPRFNCEDMKTSSSIWYGDRVDKEVQKNGLVCKTEDEAIELHDWIVEQVRKRRRIE